MNSDIEQLFNNDIVKLDKPLTNQKPKTIMGMIKEGSVTKKDLKDTYSRKYFNRPAFEMVLEEYSKDKYFSLDEVVEKNKDAGYPSASILYSWIATADKSDPLIKDFYALHNVKNMMAEARILKMLEDDSHDFVRNPDGSIRTDGNDKPIENTPALKRYMRKIQVLDDRNKQLNPEHGKLRQQEIAQEAQIATVDVMAQALVRAAELKAGVNAEQEVNQDFIDHDKQ